VPHEIPEPGGKFGPYESKVAWPILYIDGEMPFEVMRQRIVSLHGSIPDDLDFLSHELLFHQEQATLNLSDFAPQEAIVDFCLAKGIRVLFLDNLSCLFSGLRENESDAWEPVKAWLLTLRRHRIAVIVVHHAGRNPNHMRGTTRCEDDVFWVIRLEEPADAKVTKAPGARFITRFTKCRGAATEPLSYD
jgi:putative DNA primase/helicase